MTMAVPASVALLVSVRPVLAVIAGRLVLALMVFVSWHRDLSFQFLASLSSSSVSAGWDADLDMRLDVQKASYRRGVGKEMGSPAQPEEELADLRRRMVASAARHLSPPDAEEVTQEALLRIVQDRRPSAVPLSRRAFRKLRDTRAELFRSNQRKFETAAKPLEDAVEKADERSETIADLIGLEQIVTDVAGAEVMRYTRLKAAGLTDAEVAEQPGWDVQRTDAARKKLSRKQAALMKLIKESATE